MMVWNLCFSFQMWLGWVSMFNLTGVGKCHQGSRRHIFHLQPSYKVKNVNLVSPPTDSLLTMIFSLTHHKIVVMYHEDAWLVVMPWAQHSAIFNPSTFFLRMGKPQLQGKKSRGQQLA